MPQRKFQKIRKNNISLENLLKLMGLADERELLVRAEEAIKRSRRSGVSERGTFRVEGNDAVSCTVTRLKGGALDIYLYDFKEQKAYWYTSSESEEEWSEEELKEYEEFERSVAEQKAEKAREDVEERWKRAEPTGESSYLARKGLKGLYGARLYESYGAWVLMVPMYNEAGEMVNAQKIYEESGGVWVKRFESGGEKKGTYFEIPVSGERRTVYIVEGFATGASVYEGLVYQGVKDATVVVAFDAGSLLDVANLVVRKWGSTLKRLVFAADNDINDIDKKNVGLQKAYAARSGVVCTDPLEIEVVYPMATPPDAQKKTDWNDYHQAVGVELMSKHLVSGDMLDPLIPALSRPWLGSLPQGLMGERKRVAPELVVVELRKRLKSEIVVHGSGAQKSVYVWKGKCWKELEGEEERALYEGCSKMCSPLVLLEKEYKSAVGALLLGAARLPDGAFDMRKRGRDEDYYKSSFQNGTLYLKRNYKNSEDTLEFKEGVWRKEDFLFTTLPYDFRDDEEYRKPEMFLSFLDRSLETEGKEEKLRMVQEICGALLCPDLAPIIVLLRGQAKTGKSTLLKVFSKFVHPAYLGMLDPTEFVGFSLQKLMGKKVNIVTEVDSQKPLPISVLSKVVDQEPMQVRVKFKDDILATLPPLHIYATNEDLNFSGLGTSKSQERRWLVLDFDNEVKDGEEIANYAEKIWATDKDAIIPWAVAGLKRLINQRKFTTSDSVEKVRDITETQNLPAQYIEYIDSDLSPRIERGTQEDTLYRNILWEDYREFCLKVAGVKPNMQHLLVYLKKIGIEHTRPRDKTGGSRPRVLLGLKSKNNLERSF